MLLASVADIRKSPADVCQNFFLVAFNKYFSKAGDASFDFIKVGSGSAPAKVWKCPACVPHKTIARRCSVKQICYRLDCPSINHNISDMRVVTGEVAQTPDCLFNNFDELRVKKTYECVHSAFIYQNLYVFVITTCNISQAPCRFELKLWFIASLQHLDEPLD